MTILPRSRQANGPQEGRSAGTPAPLLASIHPRSDGGPVSLPDIKPDDGASYARGDFLRSGCGRRNHLRKATALLERRRAHAMTCWSPRQVIISGARYTPRHPEATLS